MVVVVVPFSISPVGNKRSNITAMSSSSSSWCSGFRVPSPLPHAYSSSSLGFLQSKQPTTLVHTARNRLRMVMVMSMEAGIGVMGTKLGMVTYFEPEGGKLYQSLWLVSERDEANTNSPPSKKKQRLGEEEEDKEEEEEKKECSVSRSYRNCHNRNTTPNSIETGVFNKVPPELFYQILKFLSSEDLIACSLVCRYLNHVALDESI